MQHIVLGKEFKGIQFPTNDGWVSDSQGSDESQVNVVRVGFE